ncbi:MAG: imelysin family protein [Saprospiraceae bacterium]
MKKLIPLFIILFALVTACDNGGSNSGSDFDRRAMLEHYGQRIIRPTFDALEYQVKGLESNVDNFLFIQDSLSLVSLRSWWKLTFTSWQAANAFNFGPAGEEGTKKSLVEEIGTFPVSETKIEDAVNAGQWNVNDFNRDARGLLTVEYLIFGKNQTPDEVLNAFQVSPNRRNFLKALSENIATRVASVNSEWKGIYYDSFVNQDGTDVGSSTSLLYNEFVRSYEALKNFKVALPLGKRPGQIQPEPQLVEAYYSSFSLNALQQHLKAIEDLWHGRAYTGQDGPGFREYLESVEGGDALIAQTEAQLSVVKAALAAVPASPSLSEQMAAETPELVALNDELQKLTRFFKSDMSSLLGIAITYASGDGD